MFLKKKVLPLQVSPGIFEVTGKVKKLFLSFLLSGRSRRCVVVGKLPLLR